MQANTLRPFGILRTLNGIGFHSPDRIRREGKTIWVDSPPSLPPSLLNEHRNITAQTYC